MGMNELIIQTYQIYRDDDHDLAVSLTARVLRVEESTVRQILES